MISKNLYVQLLVRVLILLTLSFVLAWMIFQKELYTLSVVPVLAILIQTINLVRFLNATNRRLFYFFDAIKNEDSTLLFSEKTNDKILVELNKSLNKVNQQILKIHIENRQQEQYFRALMEHAATGMLTYDDNGFILHSNSLVKRLLSLEVLTHLNQLDKIDHKLFVAAKNIQASEQRLVTLNNERGNNQLLIKASSFIADMNSITPITSLSESLAGYFYKEGQMKSPDQVNEKTIETTIRGLEVIREQGKGLISFVDSYRKLTRLPKPEMTVFSAINLIENITILSGSFDHAEEIEISNEVEPNDLEIFADEKQISQVLINLVKNAFQANIGNKSPKVKIVAISGENGRPIIKVIDNGPGIPKDILEKIFIPFFTTKESGSGIGLSLSRQIMQLHGGSLKVQTTNQETSFSLNF